jgi:hypothetical protein
MFSEISCLASLLLQFLLFCSPFGCFSLLYAVSKRTRAYVCFNAMSWARTLYKLPSANSSTIWLVFCKRPSNPS